MGAPTIVPTIHPASARCHASTSGPSSLFRAPVPSPSGHARATCPGATVGEVAIGVPLLTCCCARSSKSYYQRLGENLREASQRGLGEIPLAKDSHQGLGEVPSPRMAALHSLLQRSASAGSASRRSCCRCARLGASPEDYTSASRLVRGPGSTFLEVTSLFSRIRGVADKPLTPRNRF